MKRASAVVLVLLILAMSAEASETSWAAKLRAFNEFGMNPGSHTYVGTDPAASDGYDNRDTPFDFFADTPGFTAVMAGRIPGQSSAFLKNAQAPTAPPKTWDLYLAANRNATYSELQIRAYTIDEPYLPISRFQGVPVRYYLEMLDNKGIPGAPANGTRWYLPIPTVHSTDPFWVAPVNLPVIVLSASTSQALFSEGYRLQFVQEVVPEPSGLLALGTCLSGLVGCALRRRRA